MNRDLIPPADTKALIFDCDGTLAITKKAHFEALRQAFRNQGFVLTESWYYAHTGLSLNEACHAFGAAFDVLCDISAVRADHAKFYPDQLPLVRPVVEVVDIARQHKGLVPLAVASGGDQSIVELTLTHTGIRHLFDHVVAIGTVRRGKPAPDLFLEAADRLCVRPEACFVYEDSDEGMEAAKRAAMPAIDIRLVAGLQR